MSETPHGSAANQPSPPSASKPPLGVELTSDRHKVDIFYRSAFWLPAGEQQPEGFWLSPVHRVARSITRSPFTREGALYEPAFRTIRTGDLAKGELVMHSLVASSPFGLAQPEAPAKHTLIFGATLLNRSYTMGIVGEGVFGFVLLFGMPINGIRRLILPRHSLYPVLQDCLLEQINDADADIFMGSSKVFEFMQPVDVRDTRSTVAPSLAPNSCQVASIPKVQLVADVHLSGEERAAFICLASVFIHLHGVDAMQDPRERIRVTKPVAHLDTLIRLTMEAVPDDETRAPNFLEREFQLGRTRILTQGPESLAGSATRLVSPCRPTESPPSFLAPRMYYAEDVLALLPAGTVIVDRLPSSRKRAAETIEGEWNSMGKIVQYNLSARATPTVLTPGFRAKITRYGPYSIDATLTSEPPADDEEVMFGLLFGQQVIVSPVIAPKAHPAAVEPFGDTTIIEGEVDMLTYDGEMEQKSKAKGLGETAGNAVNSEITLGNQGTLLQQRTRSNSSLEPPATSLSTKRPELPKAERYRRDYDPPTTPYLRARETRELEEGELEELEYMDEEEFEHSDHGPTVVRRIAMDIETEAGAVSARQQSPVNTGNLYATDEVFPITLNSTKAKTEPVPARASSPAVYVEYPSIWQTLSPDPFRSLREQSSVISVNTVITEDPADIPRPLKPPLPPLK
ncbi:hypothetical protein C8J56DRAFT_1049626 [Mycena floridula]|nr:hypothetical protein C8J56DRAFT_1049626 [Mycena floridula]